MRKSIKELTSNQYYKGLNNRFDNRVKKLKSLGFSFDNDEKFFYQKTNYAGIKLRRVDLTFIMHADKRAWDDKIKSITNNDSYVSKILNQKLF